MIDLRTDKEKEREAKQNKVCCLYADMCNAFPNESAHRKMRAIAQQENLTVPGVRYILEKHGLYQPNK